ncbi:MAG: hypothetical protein HYZ49_08815 [Chloroflexi bacterium]|nr:hypothetical protein [Chloroflexota bacterium]
MFIALLAACQPQLKSGDVLFADDFAKTESGWNRGSDADATTDYLDGEYQIKIFTANLNVWSVGAPAFGDALIDVNARTAGGPDNNLFGLICRYQDDQNFYFLVISADSYYGIGKYKEGASMLLNSAVYEYSDIIPPGPAAHHLTATCIGDTLTLSINGTKLAQAKDTDFKTGKLGLIAGSFDEPEVDVRFDNLAVTQP